MIHTASEQSAYILLDNVPDEPKTYCQWVAYRLVDKQKPDPARPWKKDKPPYNVRTGKLASVNDPATWCPYHVAVAAYEQGNWDGVGFVFSKDDTFVGIDLDNCRDPQTGKIEDWARDIMDRFSGWYWETSPSGHGVKGLGKGRLPPGGRKHGDIEVYDQDRYFTVTGEYIAGTTLELGDHTPELEVWHALVFGKKTDTQQKPPRKGTKNPHDLARVKDALSYIPAVDYGVWLPVGMALQATGWAEAFPLWCDWSRTCPEKFNLDVCHKKWASFSIEHDNPVTVATIVQLAKEHGWRPSRNGQSARTAGAPPELNNNAENARMTAQERELQDTPQRGSFRLVMRSMALVVPEDVRYLWAPYFPLGKLTLVGGDGGAGKTYLTLAVMTALSLGHWPFYWGTKENECTPGDTVFFSCEDGVEDTLAPRLIALGADRTRIHVVDGKEDWKGNLHRIVLNDATMIIQAIGDRKAKLAVFDPFQGFLPPRTKMNDMETVRPVLTALIRIAQQTRCCIALLGHLNKAKQESANYKFLGSVDWYNGARSAMMILMDPDEKPDGRLFFQVKNSLSAMPPAVRFTISEKTDPPFLWGKSSELTADEILAGDTSGAKTRDAEMFLHGELAHGARPQLELEEVAKAHHISGATLRRAKSSLKIRSRKEGFGKESLWMWALPAQENTDEGETANPTPHR